LDIYNNNPTSSGYCRTYSGSSDPKDYKIESLGSCDKVVSWDKDYNKQMKESADEAAKLFAKLISPVIEEVKIKILKHTESVLLLLVERCRLLYGITSTSMNTFNIIEDGVFAGIEVKNGDDTIIMRTDEVKKYRELLMEKFKKDASKPSGNES
jgi:hypothetical protein